MDEWMDGLTDEWMNGQTEGQMDGSMTCDFSSVSIVFQSYQDDGQVIMKNCVQWNPI